MGFIFERRINYYETDKMGVVHHSNYIKYLEEARCYMLDYYKIPYSKMESLGIMIPVLSVQCDYKNHVTFDDILCIDCTVTEFTGVRMAVEYILTDKKTGKLVMTAKTKHCFTTTNLRPCNLKKHYLEAYNTFMDLSKKN